MAVAEPLAEHVPEHVAEIPTVTIAPPRGAIGFDLQPLWEYRAAPLLLHLARPEGALQADGARRGWAILQPLLTMIVFTIFFGRLAGLHVASGVPYPVFSFAGTLPWTFFANALTSGVEQPRRRPRR